MFATTPSPPPPPPVKYTVSAPEITSTRSAYKPHYELVLFNNCFAHDKFKLWKESGAKKCSVQEYGCAINTMRFLNLIDETDQSILLDQLTDSGTSFKDIIQYVKSATNNSRKIVEKKFPVTTLSETIKFFNQLAHWMPNNTCIIFRENFYGYEDTDVGHTAIYTKYNDQLYLIDPIYNRLVLHNNKKYYNQIIYNVNYISLMFQLNLTPLAQQHATARRERRRRRRTNRASIRANTNSRSSSRASSRSSSRRTNTYADFISV